MKTTGRKAYQNAVTEQTKQVKRGYGFRVLVVNSCPDCHGAANKCATCGDETDRTDVVKVGNFWYVKLSN